MIFNMSRNRNISHTPSILEDGRMNIRELSPTNLVDLAMKIKNIKGVQMRNTEVTTSPTITSKEIQRKLLKLSKRNEVTNKNLIKIINTKCSQNEEGTIEKLCANLNVTKEIQNIAEIKTVLEDNLIRNVSRTPPSAARIHQLHKNKLEEKPDQKIFFNDSIEFLIDTQAEFILSSSKKRLLWQIVSPWELQTVTIPLLGPKLYTNNFGYHLSPVFYPFGYEFSGDFCELVIVVEVGKHDPLLKWPFPAKLKVTILNRNSELQDITTTFKLGPADQTLHRPMKDRTLGYGTHELALQSELRCGKRGFLSDNEMLGVLIEVVDNLEDELVKTHT